jgi:hypothetical protein
MRALVLGAWLYGIAAAAASAAAAQSLEGVHKAKGLKSVIAAGLSRGYDVYGRAVERASQLLNVSE